MFIHIKDYGRAKDVHFKHPFELVSECLRRAEIKRRSIETVW